MPARYVQKIYCLDWTEYWTNSKSRYEPAGRTILVSSHTHEKQLDKHRSPYIFTRYRLLSWRVNDSDAHPVQPNSAIINCSNSEAVTAAIHRERRPFNATQFKPTDPFHSASNLWWAAICHCTASRSRIRLRVYSPEVLHTSLDVNYYRRWGPRESRKTRAHDMRATKCDRGRNIIRSSRRSASRAENFVG